jgi:hypothetical protein
MREEAQDKGSPPEARSPEVEGKLRQFHRVLMSYIDFQQAEQISSHILVADLHARYPRENRILLRALNCAAIVAYCRPFSGNDPGADPKIPDLPARFLKVLTEEERKVHDVVMDDRTTVLAHSDSRAWQMDPHLLRLRGKEILIPMHHDVHAPLTRELTVIFNRMCTKLREAVFDERQRLEPEITKDLRVTEIDEEELERQAAELGVDLHSQIKRTKGPGAR